MLTWKQIASDEKSLGVLTACDEIFHERKYFKDKWNETYLGYEFAFVDLNDTKMQYSITQ